MTVQAQNKSFAPRAIRRPAGSAFTLIELLAVMAAIAIVAAFLLAGTTRMLESSKSVRNVSNLRTIGSAVLTYAADNNGVLPPDSVGQTAFPYTTFGNYVDSNYGTSRYLWDRTQPFGLADVSYVPSVDCFYSPFATAFKSREKGKLYMATPSYALIGYVAFYLPRNSANEISPGLYNDTLRESVKTPLYSDFFLGGRDLYGLQSDRCDVVFMDGHVRSFPQKDLAGLGMGEVIEYFAR